MSESTTYLTVEQARDYVQSPSADAFRKWARVHGVPRFRRGKRTLLFLRRDLDEAVGNTSRKQRAFKPLPSESQQSHRSLDSQGVSGEAVGQRHAESVERGENEAVVHSMDGGR